VTRFYNFPWLLLSLTALFWAGNAVAGRLALGDISPMQLSFLRWSLAALIMFVVRREGVMTAWPLVRPKLGFVLFLGALGFMGFNAFLYLAAHRTEGVNLLILQGAIPILILLGATLLFGERIGPIQIIGTLITVIGVMVTATNGSLARLMSLTFNSGDLLMFCSTLCYAGYALLLRKRPAVPALDLFFYLALGATLASLAALALETAWQGWVWPSALGWLLVAYCTLLPSICSQIFFLRGVELIGAARAGLCVNLIPVFGAVLMVAIGEPFTLSDGVALILVLGGVALAEHYRLKS
jgi:drug/metabolite transporter (DMT)-like permease